MTAAARRRVGNVPGAHPLEQLAELGALVVDIAAAESRSSASTRPVPEAGSYTGTVHG